MSKEDLDKEEADPKFIEMLAKRFSSDVFANRIADFCGLIRTCWAWLGFFIEVLVFIGVVWFTISEDLEIAAWAWSIFGISIFFWLAGIIFSYACKLFVGRYPGEPKQARKNLSDHLESLRERKY